MLEPALKLFKGEGHRILWMPPVTLGYLFTKTGSLSELIMASVLIAAARVFSDIGEEIEEKVSGDDDGSTVTETVLKEKFGSDVWKFEILLIPYIVGTLNGWYLLIEFFDQNDLVIVALSIGYLAIFQIFIVNLFLTN